MIERNDDYSNDYVIDLAFTQSLFLPADFCTYNLNGQCVDLTYDITSGFVEQS